MLKVHRATLMRKLTVEIVDLLMDHRGTTQTLKRAAKFMIATFMVNLRLVVTRSVPDAPTLETMQGH